MDGLMDVFRKQRTLVITMAVMIVLYLLAISGMSTRDWVITTLRGLSVGAVTFLVASGLSLIFGLMDVLNLAHGTLFMFGAYVGWSVFVRPDTFVDVVPPLVILAAGFLLMLLFQHALERRRTPSGLIRMWPWAALVLAGLTLAISFSDTPIAIWDAEDYSRSPVVNVQAFETDALDTVISAANFEGSDPLIVFGGIFLGGILLALSLAGFAARGSARTSGSARGAPWRFVAVAVGLLLLGALVHWGNDSITRFLLGISSNWLFSIAILIATLVGAGMGGLIEVTLIRPLYDRPIYQLMLTLGLAFIGTEVVRAVWGRTGFTMPRPEVFAGSGEGCPAQSLGDLLEHHCAILSVNIGGEATRIRVYNEAFLILAGLIVLIVVWALLQRSRLGMVIRAGVQDSEMVEALGINVRRVFTLVFMLGAGLAALGGVLSGPSTGLSDAMGGNLLLGALIALAIGGLTSFPGAAAGSVLVGLLQQFIIKYGQIGIPLPFFEEPFRPTPPLVPASTVLLMVIVLLLMPQGLLGRKE